MKIMIEIYSDNEYCHMCKFAKTYVDENGDVQNGWCDVFNRTIDAIQDVQKYRRCRECLAAQYNLGNWVTE